MISGRLIIRWSDPNAICSIANGIRGLFLHYRKKWFSESALHRIGIADWLHDIFIAIRNALRYRFHRREDLLWTQLPVLHWSCGVHRLNRRFQRQWWNRLPTSKSNWLTCYPKMCNKRHKPCTAAVVIIFRPTPEVQYLEYLVSASCQPCCFMCRLSGFLRWQSSASWL